MKKAIFICKKIDKFIINFAKMVGKLEKNPQLDIFNTPLVQFIDLNRKIYIFKYRNYFLYIYLRNVQFTW